LAAGEARSPERRGIGAHCQGTVAAVAHTVCTQEVAGIVFDDRLTGPFAHNRLVALPLHLLRRLRLIWRFLICRLRVACGHNGSVRGLLLLTALIAHQRWRCLASIRRCR